MPHHSEIQTLKFKDDGDEEVQPHKSTSNLNAPMTFDDHENVGEDDVNKLRRD
jgi:hypothetical protein